ncbi:potassium channel family protein [Borrelia parkeri]|uniref:Potassium uptake protein ktrA n=1 Tax=Borrelia parkeri SLO TaxID=1313294 RepID=A0ABM5PJ22_BORPR|nr:TrkA family potassium uptake protein [Borrelia parkeri]AHE63034.1 lectin [Borrelia parkeri HR1]AHH09200.1 Potassium uptake protein ktrA [Borrelia parkeri SLO]UPA10854.1 TrkA family potassium uptake protein [Borrelia parkeri]
MKTFVIIGLSNLGIHVLENLSKLDCQIIIVDTSKELVEEYDVISTESFILDQFTKNTLKKVIPVDTDAVIIDFDNDLGKSALVTHYCNLLGVKEICVKTEDRDDAEILKTLGATKIIFPSKDAARRLTPLLVSPNLSTYSIVGHDIIVAETIIPKEYVGKTLLEADLRREKGITVIAVRNLSNSRYEFVDGDYFFLKDDKIVICGKPDKIENFTNNKDLIKDLISVSKSEDASYMENSKKLGFLRFFNFMKKFSKDRKND